MTSVEPDEVHDIDPDAPLDLTGDERVDEWRGINIEEVDDGVGGLAGLLRARSRALLSDLVRPHPKPLAGAAAFIALSILCQLSVPMLIQRGIDDGIPPLLPGGDGSIRPLVQVVLGVLVATVVGAFAFNSFLLLIGRVGQDVVLDVRLRAFRHFQRMSISYHERYTSGRVISWNELNANAPTTVAMRTPTTAMTSDRMLPSPPLSSGGMPLSMPLRMSIGTDSWQKMLSPMNAAAAASDR